MSERENTSAAAIQSIFQKHAAGESVIELWSLPGILNELGIKLSDQNLFHILYGTYSDTLTLHQLRDIIAHIESRTEQLEAEHDIQTAWIAMGGEEDKTGSIRTAEIQRYVDKYGMEVRFDDLVTAYYRTKNIVSFQTAEVSYNVFKEIMISSDETFCAE